MQRGDLAIISMEDWPHDIIFGTFRILCDVDKLEARYNLFCQQEPEDEHMNLRWKWTDKMVEEGLLEEVPVAHLCLGESWYPPKWLVLSEAQEE